MALTLATAALASAAVGAAGTAYAASQGNKASQRIVDAQQQATADQLALQKDIYNNTVQANQPFTSAGYAGLDALLQQLGISTVQGAQSGADYAGYVRDNPDVASEYQRLQSTQEGRDYLQSQGVRSEADFGALHYRTNGKDEGRPLAQTQGTTGGPDLSSLGNRQTYTRPDMVGLPSAPDISAEAYRASPGYEWQLKEGNRALNAYSAARGVGQSSAAIKRSLDYSQGLADQDYQQFVGNALNIWQIDLNRSIAQNNLQNQAFESDRTYGTSVYDADRNYLTNRYDTQTNNLLSLTGIGQSAANNNAYAGSNYANNSGNILQTNANVLSGQYNQQAQNNASAWNNVAGIGQNLLMNYAGGSGGYGVSPINTVSANDNVLQRQQPFTTGNLLRAPQVSF